MSAAPTVGGPSPAWSVGTEAGRRAVDQLRQITGQRRGPMELHGLRCLALVRMLARHARCTVDEEVAEAAALLHDVGLYPEVASDAVYVTDGRRHAVQRLAGGWEEDRRRRLGDAIELHHRPRSVWAHGCEAELLRRADQIELSAGLVSHGLPRHQVRELFAQLPRDGLYGEIARLVARVVRERPATVPKIFRPRGG